MLDRRQFCKILRSSTAHREWRENRSCLDIDSNLDFLGKLARRRRYCAPDVLALSPRLDPCANACAAGTMARNRPFRPAIRGRHRRHRRAGRHTRSASRQTVVFGIGGSSLGGEMLVRILGRGDHPVRFFDNIDPGSLIELTQIDWRETGLLVVSKSGATAETLCQLLSLLPQLERDLGPQGLREHVRVITENRAGPLFQIGRAPGARNLRTHRSVDAIRCSRSSACCRRRSLERRYPRAARGRAPHGRALPGRRHGINPAFWNGACQYLHAERARTLSGAHGLLRSAAPVLRWLRFNSGRVARPKHDRDGRANPRPDANRGLQRHRPALAVAALPRQPRRHAIHLLHQPGAAPQRHPHRYASATSRKSAHSPATRWASCSPPSSGHAPDADATAGPTARSGSHRTIRRRSAS